MAASVLGLMASIVRDALSPSSDDALLSGLARAGHSAVVWEDTMIVYGGYRFPLEDEGEDPEGSGSDEADAPQLLRYGFASGRWEELTASAPIDMSFPEPRHGHTAVVYNVSVSETQFCVCVSVCACVCLCVCVCMCVCVCVCVCV